MAINISVVIPTYNRVEMLKKCLQALLKQDYPGNDYEIIVCDDGSTDGTANMVKQYPKVKYLYQKNAGPAAARNLGIRASCGEIIAFTDDDCQVDPDWLKEIDNSFKDKPEIAGVGGVTYTVKEKVTPLTCQIQNTETWNFPTCNVAYKKAILEKIGNFDAKFPATNEDADLSWRVEKVGQIWHNLKMRVLHPPRRPTFINELKGIKYLESEFYLFEKMPQEYRLRRGSPYKELIYLHGIKLPAKRLIKAGKWLFKNPFLYLELFVLVVSQDLYLIWLLPGFILRQHRRMK